MQQIRLVDPNGYTVPGTVQSNVPDANADKVRDRLLHEVAPKHAADHDYAGYDARNYRVQPTPARPVSVDLHRVIVRHPVTYIPTGPSTGITVGAPPEGSFDPAAVRITPVAQIRPGDVVLGTIQHHHDNLLNPLDRAQWVSYFTGLPKAQEGGARPFDPAHCDWCAHNDYIRQIGPGTDWVSVDGCTLYSPDSLLLVVPRELAGLNSPAQAA
ncbi:hypothetical protein AB0D12_31985 [Streptomyces sp. NPDC048479]|uniref:hypothetical protein n=1 Tax=Streptomyces sp. NPDC048479 TaxID=3154725 RepID=UPI003447C5C1